MNQIITQRLIVIVLTLVLFCHYSCGQKNVHDDIMISVDANRATYYQGEPFRIYFEIENLSNDVKPYRKPLGGPNLKYELKNLKSGQIIKPCTRITLEGLNTNVLNEKTSIPPKMKSYESVQVGKKYGTVLLTNQPVTGYSRIRYNLVAIPEGEYELTLSYSLIPSKQVISATHRFKVVAVPPKLVEARDQFIETTYYANESSYKGKKNYAPNNPNSYENFLSKYGNTVFADYAWIDMTITIYSHPGPSATEMVKKWNEYLSHYSNIQYEDVRLNYVRKLPVVVTSLEIKNAGNAKVISQHMLKNELKNSYRASELFILGNVSVDGLRNYASK